MPDRVYYCPDALSHLVDDAPIEVQGDEARHLTRVRRVGVGAVVEVFDGQGLARVAEVVEVSKDRVRLQPKGPPLPDRVEKVSILLATAVPKGDRFDWLIEKATEIGVSSVVPILTERSVVDPRSAKLDRLRRVIVEAAKQCGRNRLMTLAEPVRWHDFVRSASTDACKLIAHPGGRPFVDWPRPKASTVVVAIGPEGGFREAEVELALASDWISVTLGATLLRIETAALVASARVLARAD